MIISADAVISERSTWLQLQFQKYDSMKELVISIYFWPLINSNNPEPSCGKIYPLESSSSDNGQLVDQ